MMRNIQEALTTIENKARVRTCRNKPQVSNSGGSSIQSDAITALTKQVEDLISSMQEAFNRNQEASIQLMQNQMGQMEETFQERPSCVPPSDTETYPREERKAVTTMSGLTLDGSFISHSNFLVYQDEELKPETITEVVEIASSHSTPLPLIPYPSRLQEENFQALKNPTRRADHFVYRIDIVESLCDKFPIENNSLSGNPTPSSNFVVESFYPLPTPFGNSDSLLEETNTLLSYSDDSLPDYETICFDIKEKSSGSTISHSDHSLPEYESLCFDVDHIEENSNGSTTSHSDLSLPEYESFHFDLSIDPLPPADRKANSGEFTRLLKENISETSTKDLKINELNDFPLFLSDCDSIFSEKFSEIDLLVLFPSGNKDKVFDPGIFTINGVHSKRFSILLLDDFSSILFVRDFLFLTDPSEIETFLSFPSGNEDKVFDPGILLNNGIFSFTRKSPHLLIDNFMIDNCHILSEISLKIVSSISFHPKDKEIRGETPFDREDLHACFQSSNHT
ncbi:hypothetical protein Tco_1013026, partial [Tanacetum coccineum]